MKLTSLALLGFATASQASGASWSASSGAAAPRASTAAQPLAPGHKAPEGCQETVNGWFHIYALELSQTLGDVQTQSCYNNETLVVKLNSSVLVDAHGRIGSIVANHQFQFDGPPQSGSNLTSGFSICRNNSLALGMSTVFHACLSGDFENLYYDTNLNQDTQWPEQCKPKKISVMRCDEDGAHSSASPSTSDKTPAGKDSSGSSDKTPAPKDKSGAGSPGSSDKTSAPKDKSGAGSPSSSDKTSAPKDKSGAGSPSSSDKTPAPKDKSGGAKPAQGAAGAASPSMPVPICQIGDGQIQVHTKPCGGVPLVPPAPKVSSAKAQMPSEAPKAAPAPAPKAAPVPAPKPATVKPQAPPTTAVPGPRPVVQIGDGQIQVHSPTAAPRLAPAAPTAAPKPQAPTAKAVVTAGAIRSLPATAAVLLVAALGTFLVL